MQQHDCSQESAGIYPRQRLNKIIVKKLNEVYLKLTLDLEQSLELFEYFKCQVPGCWFNKKYKAKIWDGTVSLFDRKTQTLPTGLLKYFINFTQEFNYDYEIQFEHDPLDISNEQIEDFYKTIFKDQKWVPRDYQDTSIKLALKNKRGIIESCVGSGKSIVIYILTRYLLNATSEDNAKILIIVPTINLVNQLFSDFKDYGFENIENQCNILFNKTAKIFNEKLPITISTFQSLANKSQEFFEDFIGVIVDEAQTAKAISIKNILSNCVNAEYRIGTTGTLPKEKLDLMTIYGYLGPRLFYIKSKELIDKGILSKITVANIILKYPDEIFNKIINKTKRKISCRCGYKEEIYLNDPNIHTAIKECPLCGNNELNKKNKIDYNDEIDFIIDCKDRNKIFRYIIKNATKINENVLILVDRLEHLNTLKKYLEKECGDRKIVEICGETDADLRENIRKQMIDNGGFILVATYKTVQLGVNIPRLHHVILGSSGVSEIKIIQSIGRGLRLHETKDKMILWDIIDDLTFIKKSGKIYENFVFLQHKERLKYYDEQGFKYISKKIYLDKI